MTQREARVLFTKLSAELIIWVDSHNGQGGEEEVWEVAWSEGYVKDTDAADGDHDGPHMAGGAHYLGTGGDLNLYVNGEYITDGKHRVWAIIGAKWKTMHPRARWGGDFKNKAGKPKMDSNHISIEYAGRA